MNGSTNCIGAIGNAEYRLMLERENVRSTEHYSGNGRVADGAYILLFGH